MGKATKEGHRKKRSMVTLVCVSGVLTVAVILFICLFHIKKITVEGNIHYTEEEIKAMIMGDAFSENSILFTLKNGTQEMEDVPFLESIRVEMIARDEVRLMVTEKSIVGYLEYNGAYWYFDRNGIVVEKTAEPAMTAEERIAAENAENTEDGVVISEEMPVKNFVPLVEGDGLRFEKLVLNQKLDISDPGIFNALSSINQMINKDNIPPDKVIYDADSNITLIYGDIEVWLGKDEHLEEKMNTLASIMQEMDGLSGILHLEEYDSSRSGVIFEKNT